MAGTLVFMFLVDNFSDNAQNRSLEAIEIPLLNTPILQECDSSIADPLLQRISKELNVIMVPKWMTPNINITHHTSYETLMNVNKILTDGSVESTRMISSENQEIDDLEYMMDASDFDKAFDETNVDAKGVLDTVGEMDEHLVAIFESLMNITAQTCSGTLLSSHWVLTAATCVNLLGNLAVDNNTNTTEESVYTVIVNASDPLIDGTAHNVTEVHLHPQPQSQLSMISDHQFHEDKDVIKYLESNLKPDLALMKIYPPANAKRVKIEEVVTPGMKVTVYGWAGLKNDSSHDVMRAVYLAARTISPQQCAALYNVSETAELCLSTSPDNNHVCEQMTWGGPVTHNGALVAVARADGHAPLAAWPLASHSDWIHGIIDI